MVKPGRKTTTSEMITYICGGIIILGLIIVLLASGGWHELFSFLENGNFFESILIGISSLIAMGFTGFWVIFPFLVISRLDRQNEILKQIRDQLNVRNPQEK